MMLSTRSLADPAKAGVDDQEQDVTLIARRAYRGRLMLSSRSACVPTDCAALLDDADSCRATVVAAA
jgi:hypothetical protein